MHQTLAEENTALRMLQRSKNHQARTGRAWGWDGWLVLGLTAEALLFRGRLGLADLASHLRRAPMDARGQDQIGITETPRREAARHRWPVTLAP